MKRTRKQVKADRLWKHWLHWLSPTPFGPDLKPIPDYNPGTYRNAFERFQTHGPKALTENERYGVAPLLAAQKAKEVFLTSLAEESMEWWAKDCGRIYPWLSTLSFRKDSQPMDRLTYAAILRTMRSLARDPLDFFLRHPGIAPELKQRYLSLKIARCPLKTRSDRPSDAATPRPVQNVRGWPSGSRSTSSSLQSASRSAT